MTTVVDASVVVAALVDAGGLGGWAEDLITSDPLAAPHLMPAEVANALRRNVAAGAISTDTATIAHADLLDLRVALFAYAPLAERVWELRHTVTAYDAWYVALAERLETPLATLDERLRRAPGLRCEVVSAGGAGAST